MSKWEKLRKLVKDTDKEILRQVVSVDGHTIYDPQKFLDLGLDKVIVEAFTKKLRSGDTPKEVIYQGDREVASVTGVYGLELLEFIARVFDVDSWKMGRGSRAAHLTEQLMEKWK